MNLITNLRGILNIFGFFSVIYITSVCGVFIINQEMHKIGLWNIAYIILCCYIFIFNSPNNEEHFLILKIMSFILLYNDTLALFYKLVMTIILSIMLFFIFVIKFYRDCCLRHKEYNVV